MTARKLRAGIVGYGKMGQIRARCIEQRDDVELVAICEIDPEVRKPPGVVCHTDHRQLLAEDLDVVFVCTYNNAAPEVTIDALESDDTSS